MEKYKNYIAIIKKTAKNYWRWLNAKTINIFISGGVLFLIVAAAIFFYHFVLPILIVVVILFFIFFGNIKISGNNILTLQDDGVCWEIAKAYHNIFSSVSGVLSEFVVMPATVNDIYDQASYKTAYKGVSCLRLNLLLKNGKDVTEDDCKFIKIAVQKSSNARILDGHLAGFSWAVPYADNTPILKIASVECAGKELWFTILLTNNEKSVQAAKKSDKPPIKETTDDTDPIFKGGDK